MNPRIISLEFHARSNAWWATVNRDGYEQFNKMEVGSAGTFVEPYVIFFSGNEYPTRGMVEDKIYRSWSTRFRTSRG